ncbi:MAG: DUF2795 domain-containing protein [Actinomycetota bacterium]|nr:DUF2795 domain-containing protein [Actinomycetota bacterium]
MERMSDKHNPQLDEAMKRETDALRGGTPQEARAEEFREMEGPGEGEPAADAVVNGERDLSLPDNVMTAEEANRRAELARHLPMHTFPARPEALAEAAREQHAPDAVCAALSRLPDRLYDNVAEVWEALGGRVEHRS